MFNAERWYSEILEDFATWANWSTLWGQDPFRFHKEAYTTESDKKEYKILVRLTTFKPSADEPLSSEKVICSVRMRTIKSRLTKTTNGLTQVMVSREEKNRP